MADTSSSCDSDSDRSQKRSFWDEFNSDDSDESSQRSPLPRKKPKLELKYDEEESNDYIEIEKVTYKSEGRSLNIKHCFWNISGFPYSDVFNEKGSLRSKIYRAGDCNEFQFYFVMEKLETDDDTHFGIYVCVLNNVRFGAIVSYKSYIVELRGHKYPLNSSKKQKFPRKSGFRFLGSLSKARIMDDEYWVHRYVPEDDLTLMFNINVYFKTMQSDFLEKLLEDNTVKDITLVVKEKEFPANKTILKERSSTFAKLLSKNKKATKLEIKDVDPDIMKQLLLFMYTGYVTKLFTDTDKLSAAADKYKLKELKAMCKKVC